MEIYSTAEDAKVSGKKYAVKLCGYNLTTGGLWSWWTATDADDHIDTRGEAGLPPYLHCWEIRRVNNGGGK